MSEFSDGLWHHLAVTAIHFSCQVTSDIQIPDSHDSNVQTSIITLRHNYIYIHYNKRLVIK